MHLDVDVLDECVMPAVDCPGRPGFLVDDLVRILAPLVEKKSCHGMTVTVYDPERDADGSCAEILVRLLKVLPFYGS